MVTWKEEGKKKITQAVDFPFPRGVLWGYQRACFNYIGGDLERRSEKYYAGSEKPLEKKFCYAGSEKALPTVFKEKKPLWYWVP